MLACLAQWGADAVMLSAAAHRSESAQTIKEAADTRCLPMVLVDAEHIVTNLYEAQTTPHVFVVDRDGILRYCGAVDDVTFHQRMAGLTEMPTYGCAIVRLD
jgi:hypothetical protein